MAMTAATVRRRFQWAGMKTHPRSVTKPAKMKYHRARET
jgi:hypothetical protein